MVLKNCNANYTRLVTPFAMANRKFEEAKCDLRSEGDYNIVILASITGHIMFLCNSL